MITYDESKTAKIVDDIAEKIAGMFRDAAHPVPVRYHRFLTEFLQNDPEQIAAAIIERAPEDKIRVITTALARQLITLKREG